MMNDVAKDLISAFNYTHANRAVERIIGYILFGSGVILAFIGSDYLRVPREDLYLKEEETNGGSEANARHCCGSAPAAVSQ